MEIAWAAGLFDGEGSATTCRGRPRLQLKMVDGDTVHRFCRAVGAGKVYGPYKNNMGSKTGYTHRDFYLWVGDGEAGKTAAELMNPWLSNVRRQSIARVYEGKPTG